MSVGQLLVYLDPRSTCTKYVSEWANMNFVISPNQKNTSNHHYLVTERANMNFVISPNQKKKKKKNTSNHHYLVEIY